MSHVLVSRSFYTAVTERYPILRRDPSLARLAGYLIWPSVVDDHETHMPVLSTDVLMDLSGKDAGSGPGTKKHFSGQKFLEQFRDQVLGGLAWSKWSSMDGRARIATAIPWPDDVDEMIHEECGRKYHQYGLVYLADGTPYGARKRHADRAREQSLAESLAAAATCDAARRLLTYLNSRPANRYLIDGELLDKAHADIVASVDSTGKAEAMRQIGLLRSIECQGQPFYQPSSKGRSVRVFPLGGSLLCLPSRIRRILTPSWTECDLVCSQLAIVAKDWGCKETMAVLESGADVWQYFADVMDVPLAEASKRAIKEATYSLCYGMSPRGISAALYQKLGVPGVGRRFLNSAIACEVLGARKRTFAAIENDGGCYDAFGTWISAPTKDGHHAALSVAAQRSQSIELDILAPVVELAAKPQGKHGFSIMLWQHDGFSFVPHTRDEGERWVQKLVSEVSARCKQRGLPTRLAIK